MIIKKLAILLILSLVSTMAWVQTLNKDWITYYGGQLTAVSQVLYDSANDCIYIAGTTADTGIATAGTFKSSIGVLDTPVVPIDLFSWKTDLFLVKFDKYVHRLWGTYIGGTGAELYPTICLDQNGNILVHGLTRSTNDIATTGTFKTTKYTDSLQPFLTKFNPSGERLWGTYYGADSLPYNTFSLSITSDTGNNIYVSGNSNGSSTGIATAGSLQATMFNVSNDYVMKFSSDGDRIWGTYLGNTKSATARVYYSDGYLYVFGETNGDTTLGTVGSYLPTSSLSTIGEGFVNKWNLDGERLWGTYIYGDGTGKVSINCLNQDSLGNIYISGYTGENSNISTPGTYQETKSVGIDMFVMKLEGDGSNRIWGTYLGGNNTETRFIPPLHNMFAISSQFIAADGSEIYVAGGTASTLGMPQYCGYEEYTHKSGFIAKFNNTGNLLWGNYYDAPVCDMTHLVNRDQEKSILIVSTTSFDSLATPDSWKDNKSGLYFSGLLGRLDESCPNDTVNISYTFPNLTADPGFDSYTWYHNGIAVSTGGSETYNPGADTTGFYYVLAERCGCNYTTDTFYFDYSGIEPIDFQQHFNLFPNPTPHSVQLQVLHKDFQLQSSEIYVYNLLGQQMKVNITVSSSQVFNIDLAGLPSGVYQLQIQNNKGIWTQKLVKK